MTTAPDLALQQHPLSAAFPSMPEKEIEALTLDIEAHGQREQGVLLDGMVLDGWHRYIACDKLGIEFKAKEYEGDDPRSFVISRNLHRRHLTAGQRVAAVAMCAEWAPAHRPGNKGGTSSPLMTNKALAEAADASEKTVKQVKAAIRAGLGEAVKEGQVSAKDAAMLAKGETPTVPKLRAVVAGRDVEKLYEAAKAELADYKERYETLGETARELQDKLEMFEATEPDEQQKMIATLQKLVQRKDGEIARQRGQISDLNNKCNALIRQVKSLQKKAA